MILLSVVLSTLSQTDWEVRVVDLINVARKDADTRELLIHGSLQSPRKPLRINPLLTKSAAWWCSALKGSGLFDHFGHVNASGFLIDPTTGKVISRVWLPSQPDGLTFWWRRELYLGLDIQFTSTSENGVLIQKTTPENVVSAWTNSGWAYDPLLASKHYSNLVDPLWTDIGVATDLWGSGKRTAFADFAEVP